MSESGGVVAPSTKRASCCGIALGGLAFVGLRRLFRRRRYVRGALFRAILVLIALRGLRPVSAQRLLLFMPLVIVYGAALQLLWCRLHQREPVPT